MLVTERSPGEFCQSVPADNWSRFWTRLVLQGNTGGRSNIHRDRLENEVSVAYTFQSIDDMTPDMGIGHLDEPLCTQGASHLDSHSLFIQHEIKRLVDQGRRWGVG